MPTDRSSIGHKLRIGAVALLVCTAGATTAVTAASGKQGRDHPEDSTTTSGTTTSGTPRAPLISDIEVDGLGGGKLRLRTEVVARGAKVTSVRIRYRGTTYKAGKTSAKTWARTVNARAGDGNDSVIALRVTACAGSRCAVKTGSDDA
jgi:hypothetical protein